MKIFLSRSGDDKDIAMKVKAGLEAMGHDVNDMSEWRWGADFLEKMEEAIGESDRMLALWSESYFASKWCKKELSAAFKKDAERDEPYLYTAKVGKCDVPEFYAGLYWGSLQGNLTESEVSKRLAEQFTEEVAAPSSPTVSLPETPGSIFFGREAYEARLDQAVGMANAASIRSINGLGGVGKTTLALHYAHSEAAARRFPIRWWVLAEGETQLLTDMARLARALGLAEEQTPDRAAAERARDWLRAEPREALILYDNAVDGALLKAWLPGPNAAIVTTRISGMAGLDEISLDVWEAETARAFLQERTGDSDAAAALALAEALEGLPLACEQAAAYCRETGDGLADYLDYFTESPLEALGDKAAGDANLQTVARTFQLAIEQAARDCPAAPAMLSVMAELDPAPLPLAVFGHERAPEGLRTSGEARRARNALTRWALARRVEVEDEIVQSSTSCISAHRLVLVASMNWPGSYLEAAISAVFGAFPSDAETNTEKWPLCAALAPHVKFEWDMNNLSNESADMAIRSQDMLANFFDISNHSYSSVFSTIVISIQNALDIEKDPAPQRIRLLKYLSRAYRSTGEAEYLAKAIEALDAAAQLERTAYPANHPELARSLTNLAIVRGSLGGAENNEKARIALLQALEIDESTLGQDHPNVANRLSNLAAVLRDLGGAENLAEARAALMRALKIDEAALGPDHPNVAAHLSNLANVLLDLGGAETLAEARAALMRALKIDEAARGPDHPSVAIRCGLIARMCAGIGGAENMALAREMAARSVRILEARLGPDHPHTHTARSIRDVEVGDREA